jgi:hypothetical protein
VFGPVVQCGFGTIPKQSHEQTRYSRRDRETTEANGGVPLGKARFAQATGIKEADWAGKFWARWGDALREAGFEPNEFNAAFESTILIEKLVSLIRELRKFPVNNELKMKSRIDKTFPNAKTFQRFGSKQQIAAKILEYCKNRPGHKDVIAVCEPIIVTRPNPQQSDNASIAASDANTKEGHVYMALLTLGREKRHKIGKAILVERRTDQISIQLPEDLTLVHAIRTDDAYGIEDYWHRRFAAKNTKGEWFSLSRQDIDAFKRRKFM